MKDPELRIAELEAAGRRMRVRLSVVTLAVAALFLLVGRAVDRRTVSPNTLVLVPTGHEEVCPPYVPSVRSSTDTIYCDTIRRSCQTPEGGRDVRYRIETAGGLDTRISIDVHVAGAR